MMEEGVPPEPATAAKHRPALPPVIKQVVCGKDPAAASSLPQRLDTAIFAYLRSLHDRLLPILETPKQELSATTCARCGAGFPCRTALFQHIKAKGHANLTVRPAYSISFGDRTELETATLKFLAWLVDDLPGVDAATELKDIGSHAQNKLDLEVLSAFLDSGESMLTVIIARLQCTPHDGQSRLFLMRLVEQLISTKTSAAQAVWQAACDFETLSLPTKCGTVGLVPVATIGGSGTGSSKPVSRPRRMWGLAEPDSLFGPGFELSPISLARRDIQAVAVEGVCTPSDMIQLLLPPGFDFEEECICCADHTFMCCGKMGAVARVSGCGCVACPDTMATWISTQVHDQQCGTGEVTCVGCSHTLTQAELDRLCPAASGRAEELALEKCLLAMGDWRWCPDGCGAGGFATGAGLSKDCQEFHCPSCDAASCVECHLAARYHRTVLGRWRTCAEAKLHRDASDATDEWLNASTKECPLAHGGCGAITERDGGCSHITCRVCRFEWCWLCGGKYKGKYTMGTKCPCGR